MGTSLGASQQITTFVNTALWLTCGMNLGGRNRYTFVPLFFKKKYREMLWVISVNYPVFLALIFHECFFRKKRYFFQDVATNWAPLYYYVRWYLNTEG